MEWWYWLVLGLVLVALEMAAAGGFYVIFFGLAAIAIGTLNLFDIAGPVWVQFLLFSVLSVAALLLFRRPLLGRLGPGSGSPDVDTLVGETALPLDDIAPGAVGRAELRGAVWSARNPGALPIGRGQRCVVVGVDRLIIVLEPEGARA